jgi:hypothetical protein
MSQDRLDGPRQAFRTCAWCIGGQHLSCADLRCVCRNNFHSFAQTDSMPRRTPEVLVRSQLARAWHANSQLYR